MDFRAPRLKPAKSVVLTLRGLEPKQATVLLKSLTEQGKFKTAGEVLLMLQKQNMLDVIHVNTVMSAGNDWTYCLSLLQTLQPKMLHPTVVSFNSILKVMAFGQHWRDSAAILQRMRLTRIKRDVITFNTVLGILKQSHWRKNHAFLKDMQIATVAQDAFSVSACLHPENWRSATQIFEHYDGDMDVAGLNALIGLSRSCWHRSLQVLKNMPAMRVKTNQRSWNAFSLQAVQWPLGLALTRHADLIGRNSAASACEKQRAWRCSMELIATLVTKNLQPQVISYNCAISAIASQSSWQGIVALLDGMRLVKPDSASYVAALSCRNSDGPLAEVLLKHMSVAKVERDAVTVGAFIASCQSLGRWQQALNWLNLTPADHVSCGAAISTCEKAQRWKDSLELCFGHLRDRNIRLDVSSASAAISSCESCPNWQLPLAFLLQTSDLKLGVSQVSYTATMGACTQSWEVTVNLWSHMVVLSLEPDAAPSNLAARAWEGRRQVPFLAMLTTLSQQLLRSLSKSYVANPCAAIP